MDCDALTGETRIEHPRYGPLWRQDAVCMGENRTLAFPRESTPLYIHLTVTMRCTARCKGCINNCITLVNAEAGSASDAVPQRDAAAILNLIEKDAAQDVVVCLYGGEPLLSPEIIRETMDCIARGKPEDCRVRFMIYTNGMPLKEAVDCDPVFAEHIWLYSVSIDGGPRQHDAVRPGTSYVQIADNLKYLTHRSRIPRKLMWTTLREEQSLRDAFEAFDRLRQEGLIDYFFWHFVETDEPFEDLRKFACRYETDLCDILHRYIEELNQNGRLLSILHLNELILYLLCRKERNATACGVELAQNYDIVSGHIQACADLPPEYTLGVIKPDGGLEINEQDLSQLAAYKDQLGCAACGIHAYCGGRCPVQALTGNRIRVRQYCQLMRLHVAVVKDHLPEIAAALNRAGVSPQTLYDQSAFYVQFTDVTP